MSPQPISSAKISTIFGLLGFCAEKLFVNEKTNIRIVNGKNNFIVFILNLYFPDLVKVFVDV
jgi:hypothetical protein